MKYIVSEDIDVIQNIYATHPVPITDMFRFVMSIPDPCKVNHIDLFFSKPEDCTGTLTIHLKYKDKFNKYNIAIADIKSDTPLRLTSQIDAVLSDAIECVLTVKYTSESTLALWVNTKGPCILVNGQVDKEVNVKKSFKISVITPVYKSNITYLDELIKSVEDQIYTNWELCIVDDGSRSRSLTKYLNNLKNKKIKVKINKINKGIAAATNDCLAMATGKYICFLDHDDLLTRTALLDVASEIDKYPDTDMIYTDEDKLYPDGNYGGAFYKPDWNYTLLQGHNYICHLAVYRRTIVNKIGGLQEGYDGSQDYDFVLRFIEHTRKIRHIPKVLYHWRVISGSTAENIRYKPLARLHAVKALRHHLDRIKRTSDVYAGPFAGHYRVEYKVNQWPLVNIIIPFKDQVQLLKNLSFTMSITTYPNYRITLINNGSELRETRQYLNSIKSEKVKVYDYEEPFNFSAINNYAARLSDADLFLFLNNDIEIMHPEWLMNMVSEFENPDVGVVGAKLLYLDHRIQHAGIFIGINGVAGHGHKNMPDWQPGYFSRPHMRQEISAVTGACMLVRYTDFEEVGGFDEDLPKAFNDVDFCLRVRDIGRLVVYTPYARLYHLESITRGMDSVQDKDFQDAIDYMQHKWGCMGYEDPYYNPNLTKKREDFSIDR